MQNGLTEGQGVRVVIENSTKIPFIVSEGVNVPPRTSTNIGLVETKHIRMTDPYPSNCSSIYPAEYEVYENFTKHSTYSSSMCRHLCYMHFIMAYCGCYFPYIEGNIPFDPSGKRFCNMDPDLNNTDLTCLDKNLLKAVTKVMTTEDTDFCKCNPECYETTYKVN